MAGTSNYIPQYLWNVITCTCLWYLLLAHRPSIKLLFIHSTHNSSCVKGNTHITSWMESTSQDLSKCFTLCYVICRLYKQILPMIYHFKPMIAQCHWNNPKYYGRCLESKHNHWKPSKVFLDVLHSTSSYIFLTTQNSRTNFLQLSYTVIFQCQSQHHNWWFV